MTNNPTSKPNRHTAESTYTTRRTRKEARVEQTKMQKKNTKHNREHIQSTFTITSRGTVEKGGRRPEGRKKLIGSGKNKRTLGRPKVNQLIQERRIHLKKKILRCDL